MVAESVASGALAVWTALPDGRYGESEVDAEPLTTRPDENAAAPDATPDESAASADAYPVSTLADPLGMPVGTALPDGRYGAADDAVLLAVESKPEGNALDCAAESADETADPVGSALLVAFAVRFETAVGTALPDGRYGAADDAESLAAKLRPEGRIAEGTAELAA